MLFVINLKCFLLHVKQIWISTPHLDKLESTLEPTEDVGHWYSIILQMNATFCLFSPSQSVISHCLQGRNPLADGAVTLWAVSQCARGLWSGAEAVGAAGSGGGAAAFSRPSGGSMGSARCRGRSSWSASRGAFSGNPWRLRALLCQKVSWN